MSEEGESDYDSEDSLEDLDLEITSRRRRGDDTPDEDIIEDDEESYEEEEEELEPSSLSVNTSEISVDSTIPLDQGAPTDKQVLPRTLWKDEDAEKRESSRGRGRGGRGGRGGRSRGSRSRGRGGSKPSSDGPRPPRSSNPDSEQKDLQDSGEKPHWRKPRNPRAPQAPSADDDPNKPPRRKSNPRRERNPNSGNFPANTQAPGTTGSVPPGAKSASGPRNNRRKPKSKRSNVPGQPGQNGGAPSSFPKSDRGANDRNQKKNNRVVRYSDMRKEYEDQKPGDSQANPPFTSNPPRVPVYDSSVPYYPDQGLGGYGATPMDQYNQTMYFSPSGQPFYYFQGSYHPVEAQVANYTPAPVQYQTAPPAAVAQPPVVIKAPRKQIVITTADNVPVSLNSLKIDGSVPEPV